jgi:rSAM/selenodomain-associated transferase 1
VIDQTSEKHWPAVAVFARAPVPGQAKTRLVPLLGAEGAAQFQAALAHDVIRKVAWLRGVWRYLFFAGCTPLEWTDCHGGTARLTGYALVPQRGADLGKRLEGAYRRLLGHHPGAVVIGTDSPALSAARLRQALCELRWCDAVLGPCPDGGYYLLGLRRLEKGLFRRIRWGTSFAFRDTLHNLVAGGLSCSVLEPLPDVDRPADFRELANSLWRRPELRRLAPATWSFVRGPRARRVLKHLFENS